MTVSRADYMEGRATHRQFYAQFVDDRVFALVLRCIPLAELVDSTDPHFNDIPLRRWDAMVRSLPYAVVEKLKLAGDYLTLCTGGCILKEAARQLVEKAKS